jgi:glycogen operon protein
MIASLLLSQGIPLLLAGDEVGNSQSGNNNAYCQDNEIGWVDWSGQGDADRDISQLLSEMTALRRRFPQLGPVRWMDGTRRDGSRDVLWLTRDAGEMQEEDWHYAEGRFLGYVLMPVDAGSVAVWIMLNGSELAIDVTVPEVPGVNAWKCELTTVTRSADALESPYLPGQLYVAASRSVSIFSATFLPAAELPQ